ncbi:MAG: transcriptional repressor [Opitutales bacterium]|nr:transcriptional repressor [Opitutales bacterium]
MNTDTQPQSSSFIEEAIEYWRSKGSSLTQVRRVLCEVLEQAEDPLDAEAVLARAKQIDRLISLSTVYRTLSALSSAELLTEVEGGEGKKLYHIAARDTGASSHIVCTDCGHVTPLENPCLGLRESASVQTQGFSPKKINLRVEAECNTLKTAGNCERKSTEDQ